MTQQEIEQKKQEIKEYLSDGKIIEIDGDWAMDSIYDPYLGEDVDLYARKLDSAGLHANYEEPGIGFTPIDEISDYTWEDLLFGIYDDERQQEE